MPLPNFLIIGAAKAGTTSLYYYLRQHPQVYMSPIKEPRFFALEGEILNFKGPAQGINQTSITSLDEYFHLFAGVTDEIAIGEASTLYLHSQRALEGIKRYLPNAKLIVILRNPIERAYSSYLHLVRDGYEALSFEQALQAEEFRIQQKWQPLWYYSKRSFYYEAIKNYLDIFEHCQIKIYLYEDLAADSKYIFKDICGFLDIDDSFKPDTSIKNSSGIPKNKFLQRILISDNPAKSGLKLFFPQTFRQRIHGRIKQYNLGPKPALSLETRCHLIDVFADDILKLQNLIQRDLSKWLK